MMFIINMWYSFALCLIGLGVVSFTQFWYRWNNPKCSNGGRLPPGSMGFPLIGESLQFLIPSKSLDMPRFVKKRIARYGVLFKTSLAGRPVVISSDPEFNYFIFQQEMKLVKLWYMDSFSKLLGHDPNHNPTVYIHKYLRTLVLNHFGTECLKEKLLSQLEAMSNKYLQSWSTVEPSLELKESSASMIFDVTSKQLFNYDTTKSSGNLSKMFENFLQGLMSFPLNIPGTSFHRCLKNQKTAIKMLREILHERLNSPTDIHYGDLLDELIDDMKREEFLTEDFVVSMMFGLLLASFETISSTLTVGIMLLTDHPLVVKELREEHEEILRSRHQNVDSPLTWKEYKSMTFTNQVINETLRMSSVAPGILRKAIKDIHINGYVIPEGWTIMVVPSALQMNPDKFKDPLTFNPWRWKETGTNTAAKSFIPFGGGARNCAGAEFSRVLMSVFLHVLVTQYSWTKIKGADTARTPALSFGDGFHIKITKNSEMKANIP